MTDRRSRMTTIALAAIALGGWLIRASPLFRATGAFGVPVDYDEGVYFTAAKLLFGGVLPYRDFVFVHPPGLLYVLGFLPSFPAARVLATLIGSANIFLVGRLASRWAGPIAGLVAAALYAGYPEVVVVERGPFLEPLLNLACLSMALAWLSNRPVPAGVLGGVAVAVKLWGGVWGLAALVSGPRGWRFPAIAAATAAVLVGPWLALAGSSFVTDVVLFHAWRPPDGDVVRLARLGTLFGGTHAVSAALAVLGVLVGLTDRTREYRFFAFAYVTTAAAFLASAAYWGQYNSHLAASETVLAGFAVAWFWKRVPRLDHFALMAGAALLLAFPSVRFSILDGRKRSSPAIAEAIRREVPADQCVYAFEPADALAGGRMVSAMPDPYGAMLLDAVRTGDRFADATAAFASPASQVQIREQLSRCRYAVPGWRGGWQLSEDSRRWFSERFARVEGTELWKAR